MAKAKPIGKLTDEAAVLLQRLVRMKAADDDGYASCVTCGVRKHWKELQGGHFIGRGNAATKLMEENVNCQCQYCNAWGMNSGGVAAQNYTLYMVDMYGRDEVERMLATKGKVHKWNRVDLMELIADFKQQIRGLEQ